MNKLTNGHENMLHKNKVGLPVITSNFNSLVQLHFLVFGRRRCRYDTMLALLLPPPPPPLLVIGALLIMITRRQEHKTHTYIV